jgi:hypothetical protein
MKTGLDGLLLAWLLLAWGGQALLPWRLAGLPERRRAWAFVPLALLVAGALAAFFLVQRHPDAAVVQGLYPLGASSAGRLTAVLFTAVALADSLLLAARRSLEQAGWRIAAGFGLAFLLAASWAMELLRAGEGPASRPVALALLAALRALISLASAETLALERPRFAMAAGLALPFHLLLLPAALAQALGRHGQWFTLGAAALLFLGARWLPGSLRRPALVAATLLAGLYFGEAAWLSQAVASPGEV